MKSWMIFVVLLCSKMSWADSSNKIGTGRYVTGGVLSIYPGFGIGHAVQGRYAEKGWIFTAGEAAFATIAIIGLGECGMTSAISSQNDCKGNDKILVGLAGFTGFKIWEMVDAWYGPHREKLLSDKSKQGNFEAVVLPIASGGLISMRLNF